MAGDNPPSLADEPNVRATPASRHKGDQIYISGVLDGVKRRVVVGNICRYVDRLVTRARPDTRVDNAGVSAGSQQGTLTLGGVSTTRRSQCVWYSSFSWQIASQARTSIVVSYLVTCSR